MQRRYSYRILGVKAAYPLVFAVSLALTACAVGPDFVQPPAPDVGGYTPESRNGAPAPAGAGAGPSQKFAIDRDIPGEWWTVFHSHDLDNLLGQALLANPNLEAAQAALWQAKENLYAQAGSLLPTIDANSSATRQQFSPAEFGGSGGPSIFNLYQATVNVSYVVDVFGGTRRQIEASAAGADYQYFQLEAAYLSLTANVVTAYVQAASLRGQIDATRDIIKLESEQLDVVKHQFEVGGAAKADVLTQQSEVATQEATLPPLQKQLEQERHVLLALTGHFPSQALRMQMKLASLRLPTMLPLSLPSKLVEQRPDIRAAEAQLHQASAQIGVAVANRLPKITLTADYGTAALTTAAMFTPATAVWEAVGSGTQPLFHGFTLLHQERAARAAYDQADAQYRNAVLSAFQNVADTLRALQLDALTLRAQRAALKASSDTLDLTRGQYKLGAITYITLLNAQRSYQQARLAVVQAEASRFADTAALFQALGGGWWNRADAAPNPYSPEANGIAENIGALTHSPPGVEYH
ncbi:MAG TPA: efflux transporter outer membrane subunit [Xanthobacteraceae bacterium]|nr:efflux transporter outer membrane subunit [Xanthobacteraceae bacterium]